jgi:uncharacterized membrane-anchored protein
MLKNQNRTLLEVDTAVLVLTLAALAVGLALPFPFWGLERADWCIGILAAAVLTILAMLHMHRCLDRALDYDESTATKLIFRGYIIRYAAMAAILAVTAVTELIHPVVLCLGYLLLMKVAVYLQPFTHSFYNTMFHETDPQPEAIDENLQTLDKPCE